MITRTLQRLIDQKLTTAKEISEYTGVAPSTVYRWINGTSEPDFNAIRLLLRHLPHRDAQQAILATFIAGTPWQCVRHDVPLDLNNDGRVDHEDALTASINCVHTASASLSKLRETCMALPVNKGTASHVLHLVSDVIKHCSAVQQILVNLAEKPARRVITS